MYKINSGLLCILVLLLFSCKEENKEMITNEETVLEDINEKTTDTSRFQTQLQGTWKRVDYPFSTYEFQGSTAKLISEGQYEQPQFDPYQLATNCPFADEFNGKLKSGEMIITHPKFEACEIISLRNDTLITRDMKRSYKIVYTRQ